MKEYYKNPRQITKKEFSQLKEWLRELGDLSGVVHDLNSDEIIGGNQRSRVFNVNECEIEIVQRFDPPDEQGTVAFGFIVWEGKRYNYRQVRWTAKQCEKANIVANKAGGSFDFDVLGNQFELDDLLNWGFSERELQLSFPKDEGPDSLAAAPDELPGVASLKHDAVFPTDDPWGIPALREDRLAEIPEVIDTWAGRDVCQDAPGAWWLYNWGTDSIRGLPLDRTILAFYTDDQRFEKFWFETEKYVTKLLNFEIKVSVSPNYSLWVDAPRASQLFNAFRSRWVARYMQEAGIAIIPDVNWSDERSFEFCLSGIPKRAPALAVQLQTLATKADNDRAIYGFTRAMRELEPMSLLVYGHDAARRVVEQSGACQSIKVVYIPNRADKRRIKLNQVVKEALR